MTGISPSVGDLIPTFNKNTTEYTLYVENNVTKIDINATKEHSKATYSITGNKDLEVGENSVKINVIAEDGTKKIYKINVIRAAEKIDLNLSSLSIEGLTISPDFNPEVYEYIAELKEDISEVNVIAIPENENTPVEIIGAKDIQDGVNIISILLKSADGSDSQIYKITINKDSVTVGNSEKKSSIIGMVNNIPKDKLLIGGIAILSLGTITMLIVEGYKERKTKINITEANTIENQENFKTPKEKKKTGKRFQEIK